MEITEVKTSNKRFIAALIIASCLIAAVFAYMYIDLNQKLESISVTSGVFNPVSLSPEEIYNRVSDSVVLVAKRENITGNMVTVSFCSGFLYDDKGHIVTAYSVIRDAEEIKVIFDNKTEVKAELLGFDEYSNLAVLNVTGNPNIVQRPLLLGDSSKLHWAERVYIVGKVSGTENLLISGEVNGLKLPFWLKAEFPLIDAIAFSAKSLSLETLGAPLLNSKGEVVGMIVDLADKNSSITTLGYALSSKMMQKIASSLIKNGEYKHPWLKGVWGIDMTQEIANYMNINFTEGFLVTYVNSSVAAGGLQAGNRTVIIEGKNVTIGGDIIIKIDDVEVKGIYDIIAYLEENKKSVVKLTVIRDGKVLKSPISWPVDAFSPPPD